ncbi:type II secretion system protein GspL [Microbulbifer hainanensis]|uniref:type II secretion system protein GspL n=1 Tax=Microbulbifer hainanensis TaxID=2735675 RepID=UPI001868F6BF|nr:type II secretion system protein GspL [Microbulbifer hainanensis]
MTKSSSSDTNAESRGSHLLLLRLSESGGWDQPVRLHCWSDRGWRPVAVDEEFVRAFNPSCEPEPTPEDALQLAFPEGARALLLLPGNWVWSGVERVPKAARRQSRAVGYLVEERLAEDVEDLHFVCRPRRGDECSIYAVARDKMAALHGQLERLQWPIVTAAPEYQLLDLMEQDIALWLDGGQAHIWHRAGHGLSVRRQYLQPLLALLAQPATGDEIADADEQPPELALLGAGDEDGLAVAELESLFAEHLHPVSGSAEEALLSRYKPARLVNLLVDEYQLDDGTEEGSWWVRPVKVAAACFAAQLMLFVAAGGYYQWRASAAEAEARALFSDLLPNVTPSSDLRRQINGYLSRAGGSDSSFASQLQLLSRVWGQQKGTKLKLQSLRFDGNRGEMVLQLQAPNLTDLDTVVGNLSGGGQYRAELLAASELDEGVSGRIRLR